MDPILRDELFRRNKNRTTEARNEHTMRGRGDGLKKLIYIDIVLDEV